jgi:NAD(P)-dependent dehydrogenase (short-subunit alcohol dehydrogenase family)
VVGRGRLQDRSALITGGASGIGKATAQLFLEEDAKVTIVELNREALEDTVKELGAAHDSVRGFVGDVRSMACTSMVQAAVGNFGRLDILSCNAGVPSVTPVMELSEDQWDAVTDTNLKVELSADPAKTAEELAEWAPIMRVADPREIAHGALFLAGNESSFAVGSCLVLDGGYAAR